MIHPLRPLVVLMCLPVALSLALVVEPSWWPVVVAFDGAIGALAVVDLVSLPGHTRFRAERECDQICSLGERHRVELLVENRSHLARRIRIRDDQLPFLDAQPTDFAVTVPARSRVRVHYTLTPHRRGTYRLEHVYVRGSSRWGLWGRMYRLAVPTELRVYPDLKQISRYSMYARLDHLSLLGVRKARRIGTDNEFERLRDYTTDDNYRHIDWRTTARRRKLTVRDYQSNHSQRLVFLVDCGRMMMSESSGLSLLDHSLDAMLMLSHVALTRSDEVGLLAFSDRLHEWVPLGRGVRHQNRLVHAVHDVFPQLVESRYDLAFLHLGQNCRKRTLVVLITNLIDQVNAHQVQVHLGNLTGRHLPLGVFLRDHDLFEVVADAASLVARTDPGSGPSIFRAAAAAAILEWRAQLLRNLQHEGVLTLDLFPERLTAPLVNEYLRIKALHLL